MPVVAVGGLMAMLVVGVGIGSVLAGIWSGGKVELGIVPLGALGIVIASLALAFTGSSHSADVEQIAAHDVDSTGVLANARARRPRRSGPPRPQR